MRENLETGFAPLKSGDRKNFGRDLHALPGLENDASPPGGDLSGGQQQQRAISYLRSKGEMAIILVEPYFDFARELADRFAVLERGSIVMLGGQVELQSPDVRARVSV